MEMEPGPETGLRFSTATLESVNCCQVNKGFSTSRIWVVGKISLNSLNFRLQARILFYFNVSLPGLEQLTCLIRECSESCPNLRASPCPLPLPPLYLTFILTHVTHVSLSNLRACDVRPLHFLVPMDALFFLQ